MSSKRLKRRRGCAAKKRFETREEASRFRDSALWPGSLSVPIYQCRECGAWHLNEPEPAIFRKGT
jgi:hypothetical protein